MKGLTKFIIAAVVAIVFSIVFYLNTFKLTRAGYLMPRILIVIIILLSVAMVVEAYFKEKRELKVSAESSEENEDTAKTNYVRVIVFTLLIALYIYSIKPIGYFIATPIYVIAAYLYLKATSFKYILLVSLGFTAFVYVLFVVFLKLPIPLGPMS